MPIRTKSASGGEDLVARVGSSTRLGGEEEGCVEDSERIWSHGFDGGLVSLETRGAARSAWWR
eukprot:COSAG01_NODE_3345_length_6226_cov_40.305043_2_plen_63_part_00